MPGPLWIFAYGSLIFRPGIPFVEQRTALLEGYARRFWQGSIDHRGVPGAPGRVVTLVQEPSASCWGLAYLVAPQHEAQVLRDLDLREQGGYERHWVDLRFALPVPSAERAGDFAGSTRALVYVALPNNPNFLGATTLETLVQQVRGARGPSGLNRDYVLALAPRAAGNRRGRPTRVRARRSFERAYVIGRGR
jgi:cation transport regulator ChaC